MHIYIYVYTYILADDRLTTAVVCRNIDHSELNKRLNLLSLAQLTIKDLVSELHDVVRWFQLGIYLDISPAELMKIRADHRETEPCKTEMLVTWLRQTREASWSTVVRALFGMRMGTLAQKVALKYGESHHRHVHDL